MSDSPDSLARPPRILLIGLMGSGKTTVGRLRAQRLGSSFRDSDEMIEARTGKTVAEIFASEGEERFREYERAVLRELVVDPAEACVVALGGGAPLAGADYDALAGNARVVWLQVTPDAAVSRLTAEDRAARPLLEGDPAGRLAVLLARRRDSYAAGAVTIDTRDLCVAD